MNRKCFYSGLIAILASSLSAFAVSADSGTSSVNVVSTFTDVARNIDGTISLMNQTSAVDYCDKKGLRLPTVRELAKLAASFGAQFSETSKSGFERIHTVEQNGTNDTFYFIRDGYKAPSGDLGSYFFWSSSAHPDLGSLENVYGLEGDTGYLFPIWKEADEGAVRCIVETVSGPDLD